MILEPLVGGRERHPGSNFGPFSKTLFGIGLSVMLGYVPGVKHFWTNFGKSVETLGA